MTVLLDCMFQAADDLDACHQALHSSGVSRHDIGGLVGCWLRVVFWEQRQQRQLSHHTTVSSDVAKIWREEHEPRPEIEMPKASIG